MHRRIIEGYIKYFKYGMEGKKNELMKIIMQEKMKSRRDPWMNTVRKYINEADLGRNQLKKQMSKKSKKK